MSEVVLVSGSETLAGRKLVEKLLARGSRVVAAVVGDETDVSETETPNLSVFTWNRASWFSTKAVVREAIRLYGRIDAAWLFHLSPSLHQDFPEASSGDIEFVLEMSIKGVLALSKELIPHLEAAGGFLGMVLPHRSGRLDGTLDAMSYGAFAGFAGALVRNADSALWACGFVSSSPDAEGFTAAIIDQWSQKPGKLRGRWYRYADGRRPFGGSTLTDTVINRMDV